ncbi:MAG: PTS sugar transporter [Deltaproteobacteria bacterium]|nr:PTS sugar transporter [Deltaproteobacteria bacterium]
MVGGVIVTHGALADGLLSAAEAITGTVEKIAALTIIRADSSTAIRTKLSQAIQKVNAGDGVIIFTDMFGGTPTNISLPFLKQGEVEILSGVNLPILIKFISHRQAKRWSIAEFVIFLRDCGRESIVPAGDILKEQH